MWSRRGPCACSARRAWCRRSVARREWPRKGGHPRCPRGRVVPSARDGPALRAACPPGACLRKLHLVGLTTDRDGLIFTARKGSKSGGYIVPLDDSVLEAVADVQRVRNGGRPDDDTSGETAADADAVPAAATRAQ